MGWEITGLKSAASAMVQFRGVYRNQLLEIVSSKGARVRMIDSDGSYTLLLDESTGPEWSEEGGVSVRIPDHDRAAPSSGEGKDLGQLLGNLARDIEPPKVLED